MKLASIQWLVAAAAALLVTGATSAESTKSEQAAETVEGSADPVLLSDPMQWTRLVQFSADGEWLVTTHHQRHSDADFGPSLEVRLWDVKSRRLLQTFHPKSRIPGYVSLSKDKKRLMVLGKCGRDGWWPGPNQLDGCELNVWDTQTGERLLRTGVDDSTDEAMLSEDGTEVITTRLLGDGEGRAVDIIDVGADKVERETAKLDGEGVGDGAHLSAYGAFLASWTSGNLRIWSRETDESVAFSLDDSPIERVRFGPAGEEVYIATDEAAYVGSIESGTILEEFHFCPDKPDDGGAPRWCENDGTPEILFRRADDQLVPMAVDVSTEPGIPTELWDLSNMTRRSRVDLLEKALAGCPEDCNPGNPYHFNLWKGRHNGSLGTAALSPDGGTLVIGGRMPVSNKFELADGLLIWLDTETSETSLTVHPITRISDMEFSPDGHRLVTASTSRVFGTAVYNLRSNRLETLVPSLVYAGGVDFVQEGQRVRIVGRRNWHNNGLGFGVWTFPGLELVGSARGGSPVLEYDGRGGHSPDPVAVLPSDGQEHIVTTSKREEDDAGKPEWRNEVYNLDDAQLLKEFSTSRKLFRTTVCNGKALAIDDELGVYSLGDNTNRKDRIAGVTQIAVDGCLLAAPNDQPESNESTVVTLWELDPLRKVRQIDIQDVSIKRMELVESRNRLLVFDYDHGLQIYDTTNDEQVFQTEELAGWASPEPSSGWLKNRRVRLIVTESEDGDDSVDLASADVTTGEAETLAEGLDSRLTVRASSNERYLAIGTDAGRVFIVDMKENTTVTASSGRGRHGIQALAWSSNDTQLAVADELGHLSIWQVAGEF